MHVKISATLIAGLLIVGTTIPGKAFSQTFYVADQCYLPGPHASNRCTVAWQVRNNPANNIVCLWGNGTLNACEGRVSFGSGYEWVSSPGVQLEFRRHTVWPTQDPDWPNQTLVRNKGVLLHSRHVAPTTYNPGIASCGITLSPGANIQAALNAGHATVCLNPGNYTLTQDLYPLANQTIRGTSATNRPVLHRSGATSKVIDIGNQGTIIKDLIIQGNSASRPQFGIIVFNTGNTLIDNVDVYYSLIGIGVNNNAYNVEIRNSSIWYAGDGLAGFAQPSIWISGSNNIRLMGVHAENNGVGPEGDGEISCYGTTNLLIQNTEVKNSGASGMYIVNCDYSMLLNNIVQGAKEWGLDIVNTGQPSGTDFSLFMRNSITGSRHGGVVLKDSLYNSFIENTYLNNRAGPNASGSCNGVNRRGNTTGFFQAGDIASPSGISCSN